MSNITAMNKMGKNRSEHWKTVCCLYSMRLNCGVGEDS